MEMRLYIQSSEQGGDDAVEAFQKQVMPKASVISATGDAIAIFREVQCLTPRLVNQQTQLNYLILNEFILFFTEVDMILKFFRLLSNFMVKRSIIKFLRLRFCVFFCCPIRMAVKCFLWYNIEHQKKFFFVKSTS